MIWRKMLEDVLRKAGVPGLLVPTVAGKLIDAAREHGLLIVAGAAFVALLAWLASTETPGEPLPPPTEPDGTSSGGGGLDR